MLYFFIIINMTTKKRPSVSWSFLTHKLVTDLLDVIDPVFGLLVCCRFTNILVLIPRVLMENFHFSVGHFFSVFDTDKAIALVFDLSSIKETTYTEESGLFSHYYINFFKSFNNSWIKRFIRWSVKLKLIDSINSNFWILIL